MIPATPSHQACLRSYKWIHLQAWVHPLTPCHPDALFIADRVQISPASLSLGSSLKVTAKASSRPNQARHLLPETVERLCVAPMAEESADKAEHFPWKGSKRLISPMPIC